MSQLANVPEGEAFSYIARNVKTLLETLAETAKEAKVPAPRLIPVTKSASPDEFLALMRAYPDTAAENRVQAWKERCELLEAAAPCS